LNQTRVNGRDTTRLPARDKLGTYFDPFGRFPSERRKLVACSAQRSNGPANILFVLSTKSIPEYRVHARFTPPLD